MKKELLMILVILALPTIFIMNYGDSKPTGALTSEVARLRVDRIDLILAFPISIDPVYASITRSIQDYLRAGANGKFYTPSGLTDGDGFFLVEMNLFPELFQLMCLNQIELGLVNSGEVPVVIPGGNWFSGQIKTGQIPCNKEMQQKAERVLIGAVQLDFKLVELTAQMSSCGGLAEESMQRATQNIAAGNYEAVITNLRNAWRKATSCA